MEEEGKGGINKFFFGSIRRKLVFSFVIIAALIAIYGYIFLLQEQELLKEEKGALAVLKVKEALDKIDRSIYKRTENIAGHAKHIAEETTLINSNKEFAELADAESYINEKDAEWIYAEKDEITPFMQNILGNDLSLKIKKAIEIRDYYTEEYGYAVYEEIFLTNKYGAVVAETAKTSDYRQDDEEWWQKAKELGLFVDEVIYDESTEKYTMDIAVRINDENGDFAGVLIAALNINEAIDMMNELEEAASEDYETVSFTLFSKNLKMIYSTGVAEIFTDAPGHLQRIISELAGKTKHADYFTVNDELGKEKLVVHAHSAGYKDYKGVGWFLVMEQETKELFAPITAARNTDLIISLTAMMLALAFGFFIAEKISKPVKKLHRATEELEKGNFKARVNIKTGDEFEQLGDTFNRTVAELGDVEEERKQIDKAKSEFLSITSHELRSPMTPMKAQLQMLEKGYFGKMNHKQKEALKIVLNNTSRLDEIIVDMLEISRLEAAKLKFNFVKTNLIPNIKHLVKEMQGFMPEKNIEMILRLGKIPAIEADPDRVMQVLRNILNNAVKFSPPKKKILITVEKTDNHIQFTVKDQGIGIAKKDIERIFEPFYQAQSTWQREYGGTGLGLTIVRGIVESQKGRVWAESSPGKGSTFCFTVPLKPVREIGPVKLLFSEKETIERKIEGVFSDILGVMGNTEFGEVKQTGLTEEKLFKYTDELVKQKIITKEKGSELKDRIAAVFGRKKVQRKKLSKETEAEKISGFFSEGEQ